MPATTNKQQLLAQAATSLKKKQTVSAGPTKRTVLEEVLFAICREGTTTPNAEAAYLRLKQNFFDLNEIRVSSVQEVAEALDGLPDAGAKARRIVALLQEVFEERYRFDLEDIAKKGLKQAAKQLARYKGGATDFVVAWVTQRSLGGHAIPLDAPTLRFLHRFGIIDDPNPEDLEATRGSLEHYIPKAKGMESTELFIEHAVKTCGDQPDCGHCSLKSDCPTGLEKTGKSKAGSNESKSKPKSR